MNLRRRILVIEDDPAIVLGLRVNLESEGFHVEAVGDGAAGLHRACDENWDLIVLDLMLPGISGFELLSQLRREGVGVPVLILSARQGEMDKVMGLEMGADDYVTKPFSVLELVARVRALLRRAEPPEGSEIVLGNAVIRPGAREVLREGRPVNLTPMELELLLALVRLPGRVRTRRELEREIWGEGHHGSARALDNVMARLRAKLEDQPSRPRHLRTVRGIGFRFDP